MALGIEGSGSPLEGSRGYKQLARVSGEVKEGNRRLRRPSGRLRRLQTISEASGEVRRVTEGSGGPLEGSGGPLEGSRGHREAREATNA